MSYPRAAPRRGRSASKLWWVGFGTAEFGRERAESVGLDDTLGLFVGESGAADESGPAVVLGRGGDGLVRWELSFAVLQNAVEHASRGCLRASPECVCPSSPTAVMVQRSQSRPQSQPLAVRRLRLLRWVTTVSPIPAVVSSCSSISWPGLRALSRIRSTRARRFSAVTSSWVSAKHGDHALVAVGVPGDVDGLGHAVMVTVGNPVVC